MKRLLSSHRMKLLFFVLMILFAIYVSSYIVLSRRGFAWSEAAGCKGGFYFFPPEDTDAWRYMNYGCAYFYYPLIVIDNWIGTGKCVCSEPIWKLSQTNDRCLQWICQLDSPRGRGG
jgi:hypothetical protein